MSRRQEEEKTKMKKTKGKTSKLIAYLSTKSESCKIVKEKLQCSIKYVYSKSQLFVALALTKFL